VPERHRRELRLADFDVIDCRTQPRAGGADDVGVSKVVLAAREVAELDPTSAFAPSRAGVEE